MIMGSLCCGDCIFDEQAAIFFFSFADRLVRLTLYKMTYSILLSQNSAEGGNLRGAFKHFCLLVLDGVFGP